MKIVLNNEFPPIIPSVTINEIFQFFLRGYAVNPVSGSE